MIDKRIDDLNKQAFGRLACIDPKHIYFQTIVHNNEPDGEHGFTIIDRENQSQSEYFIEWNEDASGAGAIYGDADIAFDSVDDLVDITKKLYNKIVKDEA